MCDCHSKTSVDQATQIDDEINVEENESNDGSHVFEGRPKPPIVMVLTYLGIGNTITRFYADDPTDDQFPLMEQSVISVCKRLPVVSLGRRNAAAFFQDSPTSTSGTVLVLMVGRSSVSINLTLE